MINSQRFNDIFFDGKFILKEWFNKSKIFPQKYCRRYFFLMKCQYRSDCMIIHTGTNNVRNYTSTKILDMLLKTKKNKRPPSILPCFSIETNYKSWFSKSSIGCRKITSSEKWSNLRHFQPKLKKVPSWKKLLYFFQKIPL